MSMFLSKFLSGRNNSKSKLELLIEAWTSIQKYYETAAGIVFLLQDPLKDAVDLTPIPCCLQNIVKLIQAEELECQRAPDGLETGPCLEYVLHKRVLEELVEFAKVDTPYGMRIHCLRFFCSLVTNVHAQLLPERAVHVPLQKFIASCHRLITHHYEQLAMDPDSCSEERHTAISDLSLELVKLMHGIFSHFKGTNAAMMDLFFERGWCRGLGENVWRSSKDGKISQKRRESFDEKIAWNMFLTPRFDMFTHLIDYMNIPGETGEIAREAILFALRLLDGDPEYVCYVVEYSGLCEVMAERLALFFACLPKNTGAFSISSNNRVVPIRPPRQRIQFSVPAVITSNSLMITVNAQNNFKKKRRKRSWFDANFVRTLESMQDRSRVLDEFYSFWEYLNDVARVADKRLMTALMAQLTTIFWHPVICTALSSPSAEAATAATAYTTEMIRSLTDQKLLHCFLVVLIGEEGGVGKDLEAEVRSAQSRHDLLDDDHEEGSDSTEDENHIETDKEYKTNEEDEDQELTLRILLINRIDADYHELALSTLRLFDTILETYNQFAIYNLVLRNYLDITSDGEYIEDQLKSDMSIRDVTDTSSLGSKAVDERTSTNENDREEEGEKDKVDELAIADAEDRPDTGADHKDSKTEKVRWLVERVLSLLPLEDELERMKSPPLSSVIPSDSFASIVHGRDASISNDGRAISAHNETASLHSDHSANDLRDVVVPGNSYDDYFHEARERFQYGLLARNFWQFPYPPLKTKRDYEREIEDRKGRPKRPKSMMVTKEELAAIDDRATEVSSTHGSMISQARYLESYEGLFLSRIFDQFFRMLESSMEQNLLVTSILQKITGIVDPRVDGVICDFRAIRVGCDGALYGGVWTLPSAKSNRRSLYSLLEQVTFEALKRAQLVPNFETRISLAKKRGIIPGQQQLLSTTAQGSTSTSNGHLLRTGSSFTLTPSISTPARETSKTLSRHPSLSQLVFSKTSNSNGGSTSSLLPISPRSPSSPSATKSASVLSGRANPTISSMIGDRDSPTVPISPGSNSSSSSSFFQQSQRANATPVTMTNPFAKLSNFVNSYIVLQEFCKELAAVILVRHATNFNDIRFIQQEMANDTAVHDWMEEDDEDEATRRRKFEKWKNRISVVSTIADWRSVRSLDTIDEAITSRVPSATTASLDGKR
ncbi:Retinoic acid induced 16-like protein-domain-containing protein [Radiomyces spectabilis]|uniref:Retinoic acid induced 16-like protein-domain-containing protein n=1 Tax=Radiomyces spectabilis TaxID=64574 RepID=UPI002220CB6E|nr:Retinoic acid induced 16-like protein-domain-containing protein [Radiomyces spectabilis]KAI8379161.1 Retinoic acid induced 16-like protein-domain-containing protein [Radiomyces spectabilis]